MATANSCQLEHKLGGSTHALGWPRHLKSTFPQVPSAFWEVPTPNQVVLPYSFAMYSSWQYLIMPHRQSHLSAKEGKQQQSKEEMATFNSCQYFHAIWYYDINQLIVNQMTKYHFIPLMNEDNFPSPQKAVSRVFLGWINAFLLTLVLFKNAIVSFEVWGNVLTLSSLVQQCRNDNCIYIF